MTTTSGKPSSSSTRIFVYGTTFLAGMIVGVLALITIQYFSPDIGQSLRDNTQGTAPQSSTSRGDSSSEVSAEDVAQIYEIFKSNNAFDQITTLHTTLSNISETELKDWWVQSQNIKRKSHREIFQDAIIRKLTTINPHEALSYVNDVSRFQTEALLTTLFSEWSVSELDDAVDAATKLSSSRQKVALQAILETRDDLSASELRTIAQKLNGESTFLKLVSDSQASLSIAEPTKSWDILLRDDVDDSLQIESLLIVAEAWREQIGFDVLSYIYQADIEDSQVKQQLIRSIAQVDFNGALDYTRGLSEEEQQVLCRTIVIEWASTDAQAALAAISTIEPASLASRLADIAAITWARTRPLEVIENIELIPEEFRIDTLEGAFLYAASKDPLEALAKMTGVENYVGNTSTIVQRIVYMWALKSPQAAADWVVTQYDQDDLLRRQLLQDVLPELTSVSPEKAFELAIAQPAPNEGFELEYLVIREITSENNIELAMKFLPQVRENSKGYAFGMVAEAMIRENRIKEALALGSEVNESEQISFYRQVYREWADSNPKNLFESLDGLATDVHKSLAALQLIVNNRYNPILTDEQINRARTVLSSEDAARLKRIEER